MVFEKKESTRTVCALFWLTWVLSWSATSGQNVTERWCLGSGKMSTPAESIYAFELLTEAACEKKCLGDATCGCYAWSVMAGSASGPCMQYHGQCAAVTGGSQRGGMCLSPKRSCTTQNINAGGSQYAWTSAVSASECESLCRDDLACGCYAWDGVDGVDTCTRYRESCSAGTAYGGNCVTERHCADDPDGNFVLSPDSFMVVAGNANCELECKNRDVCACWISEVDGVCHLYTDKNYCSVRGGSWPGGFCVPVVASAPRPSRSPTSESPSLAPTPAPTGPSNSPTATPTTREPTATPTVTGHRSCVENTAYPFYPASNAVAIAVDDSSGAWLRCKDSCLTNTNCACYMTANNACYLYGKTADCTKGYHSMNGQQPQWGGYCGTHVVTRGPTSTPCCSGVTYNGDTCANFDQGMCLHWQGCTWTCPVA